MLVEGFVVSHPHVCGPHVSHRSFTSLRMTISLLRIQLRDISKWKVTIQRRFIVPLCCEMTCEDISVRPFSVRCELLPRHWHAPYRSPSSRCGYPATVPCAGPR